MKWKISLLIAVVIGAFAGSWIKNLPGFVIIAYEKTTYEMRLWIAVCFLLMILALLFLLIVAVRSVFSGAGRVKFWYGGRNWRRSRKQTIEGMLAFTEGRWKTSEESMVAAAKSSDTKLINYLIAAQAAQHQNEETRRDAYLRLAHQAEPAATVAIGLTQARLQLKQGQYEQALASLNELKSNNPTHHYVLDLLCCLYERLQDWEQILALLPVLKKHRVFDETELIRIDQVCVAGLLKTHANSGDVEGLRDCWSKLSGAQRKSKINSVVYARYLIEFEQMEEAEAVLRPIIKKHADSEVVALYGNIATVNIARQLGFLESWQQANPDAPLEVHLSLAKIAFNSQLWGKASHYLKVALQQDPTMEAYLIMAKTLAQLKDHDGSNRFYQQGLEFACHSKKLGHPLSLPKGAEDLVSANLVPKFLKLEK